MASSLRLETMGRIMMPMTMEALRPLKTAMSSEILRSSGVTNSRAKYPYTTVGIPASISRTGLTTRRTRSGAYSLR